MESIVVRRRNFSYVLPLFFFLKIVHPRPLFTLDYVYFKQTTIQQSNVEKCLSNIRCWDSNPRPSDHEFPPIITRPGLYAIYHFCFYIMEFSVYSGRSLCLFLVNFNKAILCQIIVKVLVFSTWVCTLDDEPPAKRNTFCQSYKQIGNDRDLRH